MARLPVVVVNKTLGPKSNESLCGNLYEGYHLLVTPVWHEYYRGVSRFDLISNPKLNSREATWTFNLNDHNTGILGAVAIGRSYFEDWEKYVSRSWIDYANRYNLGIVVFLEDICRKDSESWRPPPWQKLLVPAAVSEISKRKNFVTVIDPDILISPAAPCIFDFHAKGKVSVVSQVQRLPYPLEEVRRRIAFLRHTMYDSRYPLDSLLFASVEDIFNRSNLEPQPDYFCGGVMVLDTDSLASLFLNWFLDIPSESRDEKSVDLSWGEEIYINHLVQTSGLANWLDYKFQTLWIYEMAWKYPFLYMKDWEDLVVSKCIESTLWSAHFLHFAGSWPDSNMWRTCSVFSDEEDKQTLTQFMKYLHVPLTGEPKGRILPINRNTSPSE